ncbi:unnamed protein product [Fraxinus pennsylvanica]|uniref:Uncharacterized protein n=1 Tax=Fraxinus pennsylvanica TaxID=56036 RepID=A0AAD2E535_9LAMI|nr:unnamed protein product [Fraxinus pennsylvanica]
MDCTIDNPIETSFFQETASFDQSQIIDNSHWVDTQLEEIHEFDETDLFDWSDLFNTGFGNPHLMVNEELNQFTPTILNSFSPRSESVNSFTLQGNLDFQRFTPNWNCSFFTPSETKHYGLYQNTPDCTIDNSIETSFFQETASFDQSQIIENSHWVDTQLEEIHEFEETDLFDWSDLFNTGSENPHLMVVGKEGSHELLTTAPTPKSLYPCSRLIDTSQDFQSSTLGVNSLTPVNELMDTFPMTYNEELNQFTPTVLNSFSPRSESVNSFTLPGNLDFQRFTPNWNWFEDGAILDDLTSWHAVANNFWT